MTTRFLGTRLASSMVLWLCVAGLAPPVAAQVHAHGSTWVHRDAEHGTILHADHDSLCTIDFPQRCYGGMMSPESLYCEFRVVPPESLPEFCHFAFSCVIEDPEGQSMMSGHRMQEGFFRSTLECAFHYDPTLVAARGVDPADLVLVIQTSGELEAVSAASHDLGESRFTVVTSRPAAWYGIVEKSTLPVATEAISWGHLKGQFR